MSTFDEALERNMVLFVGSYLKEQERALVKIGKLLDKQIDALVLLDESDMSARVGLPVNHKAIVIDCDFSNDTALQKALAPYKHRLLAVTCRAE
ncbi:hypothetical protein KC976_03455, partial [Candidatus Saccharibacteria bacterium]|nr:hypothetical protein [Candidatus Saccharibacteria bacterium]